MDDERLLAFRAYIDRIGMKGCLGCGVCCIGFRKIPLLDPEYRRIAERYGTAPIDHTDSVPMLRVEGSMCASARRPDHIRHNLRLLLAHEDDPDRHRIFREQMRVSQCAIYDERPIICRSFPVYPFKGTCIAVKQPLATVDRPMKDTIDSFALDYITTLRREIIAKRGVFSPEHRPERASTLIWMSGSKCSSAERALQYVHPFWSIWSYVRTIDLEEDELALLEACDGRSTVEELAQRFQRPVDAITDQLEEFLVYSLLEKAQELRFSPTAAGTRWK